MKKFLKTTELIWRKFKQKLKLKLQFIFEELIYELLIKQNKFSVEMKILYNETLEECDFKVIYGGEKYNPLEDLSVVILKGIIKAADHKFADKNILNLKCT